MIDRLRKLTSAQRLQFYLDYLENRNNYPPEEREQLDKFFEDL